MDAPTTRDQLHCQLLSAQEEHGMLLAEHDALNAKADRLRNLASAPDCAPTVSRHFIHKAIVARADAIALERQALNVASRIRMLQHELCHARMAPAPAVPQLESEAMLGCDDQGGLEA